VDLVKGGLFDGTASEDDWRSWVDTAIVDSERKEAMKDAE